LAEAEIARREMGRRFTTAQDNERARIARELHDDIGQSLAILGIQMMRAGKPLSGVPGRQHPSVADLCGLLKTIATKSEPTFTPASFCEVGVLGSRSCGASQLP
jgi:hypothetical protein